MGVIVIQIKLFGRVIAAGDHQGFLNDEKLPSFNLFYRIEAYTIGTLCYLDVFTIILANLSEFDCSIPINFLGFEPSLDLQKFCQLLFASSI